ncbi:hypothetical protein EV652_108371 [Kribbella steppae]|uniref:Uncharacterized protein n=1 Tax=Kribbella steppae TaxID=2512223 RepID=A0A4V6NN14_9ACTN|nr:hypothetical protein EV652_108371 [Kribbella steppae]
MVRSVALVVVVVAVGCGLGGAVVGESVVGALGRAVDHRELVLRALGWCWGGLPYVVITAALVGRAKLTRNVKLALPYLLAVWIGSAALLIPGRYSTLEERFGTAYPDARPLSFGWACGFLSTAATVLLVAIALILFKKLLGSITKRHLQTLNRVLTAIWVVLTAAGLVAALIGPMP